METKQSIEIAAPPERIWQVMTDVERWPQWTESVENVSLVDGPVLEVGARVRIKQPNVPRVTWVVTQMEPGRSFTWESSSIGMHTVATHTIEPSAGGSMVTLSVVQQGFLTRLIPGLKSMSERYVDMEARGLKQRSEELVTSA